MAPPAERYASGSWNGFPAEFRRDRLIVSVRSGSPVRPTLDAVKAALAPSVERLEVYHPPGRRWAVLGFDPLPNAETQIPLLAMQLAARPDLRYAEPDFMCSGHAVTNDPLYGDQWWPEKIHLADLWDVTRGSSRVLLAVVDSGISIPHGTSHPDHEDLSGPRYIVGHDMLGFAVPHDYTGDLAFPYWPFMTPRPPRDEWPHGTHVTGIAAATTNNHLGVSGANWESDVYVARVLDEYGHGSASLVKFAVHDIMRFVSHTLFGISFFLPWSYSRVVINLSLGFRIHYGSMIEMAEETAGGRVVICASAGSLKAEGNAIDFPAALAHSFDHVIAVGSTNQDDLIDAPKLDDYSRITLFAPGVFIPSTLPSYPCTDRPNPVRYDTMSGTSQACPIVAGAVSLLWSARPSLTPQAIRNGLVSSAVPCHDDLGRRYPRLNLKMPAKGRFRRASLPWE